jgi:hypothetical protein
MMMNEIFPSDAAFSDFLDLLAFLSVEAEDFELACAALRLQVELKKILGENLL